MKQDTQNDMKRVIQGVNVINHVMLVNTQTRCRKKLVDKLVEEYTENVKEEKLAKITLAEDGNKHKCSCCTPHIVLFSIIFTINAGIVAYFVYYKYMNHNEEIGADKSFNYQKTFHY